MKSLANTTYHQQQRERSAKAVPRLQKQVEAAKARLAEVAAFVRVYMKKQANNPIPVEFFTPAGLAAELGVNERTIRKHAARLADAGKISPRQAHPRGWLFSAADAEVIRAVDMKRGRPEKPESDLSPRQLQRRQKKNRQH
jgi:hypothetical protein